MKHAPLELLLVEDRGTACLAASEVGYFTCALAKGAVVAPGEIAGHLIALGRSYALVVPAGATGVVANEPPDRVHAPVGYGDVLYRLAPIQGAVHTAASGPRAPVASGGGRVLRAPQSGRFYRRPAPGEPPFASEGDVVAEGSPVGMLEVMKTFSHVPYRAGGDLPKRARIVRWRVADAADVKAGDALFEAEPAE